MDLNKRDKLERICKILEENPDDFIVERIDDINADIYMLKEDQRGLGGIIIGDDLSSLVCGSIYPLDHYIDEYRSGVRDELN